MGNASSANTPAGRKSLPAASRRTTSVSLGPPAAAGPSREAARTPSREASPAPGSPAASNPHRSLRTKKKSLELPDLASLALTSSSASGTASPRRAGRTSSPIPIPNAAASADVPRAPRALPSTTDMGELLLPPPPAPYAAGSGARRSAHFRGAPLPYNSTRSFMSKGAPQPRKPVANGAPAAAPDVVYSSIPSALPDHARETSGKKGHKDKLDPVPFNIIWRGQAHTVYLARAGDDNWRGRQMMEKDPSHDIWRTTVYVLPGAHHVRFIVDDQWRVSDEYHKAVDDDGSLANYINIPIPAAGLDRRTHGGGGGGGAGGPPGNISFWSADEDGSSTTGTYYGETGWTDEIPAELLRAAHEEEVYLAAQEEASATSSEYGGYDERGRPVQHPPTPNIPPAPLLPRFLEKLILNTRPNGGSNVAGRDRNAERNRARQRDAAREHPIPVTTASGTDISSRAVLGGAPGGGHAPSPLSPVVAAAAAPPPPAAAPAGTPRRPTNMPRLDLPPAGVPAEGAGGSGGRARSHSTIASATLSAHGPASQVGQITALADDNSVLPVPSHVVLHHLSTSAIRSGVLAVANTTRYRKKYLTTIYYKPT